MDGGIDSEDGGREEGDGYGDENGSDEGEGAGLA